MLLRPVLTGAPGLVFAGEATTGEECLARIADLAPDVVVMDGQMPAINGGQATTQLPGRHLSSICRPTRSADGKAARLGL